MEVGNFYFFSSACTLKLKAPFWYSSLVFFCGFLIKIEILAKFFAVPKSALFSQTHVGQKNEGEA